MEPTEASDFRAELEALGFTVLPPPEAGRTAVWFFGFPTAKEPEEAALSAGTRTLDRMPDRTFLHTPLRQIEDELREYLQWNGSLDADDLGCTPGLTAYSTVEIDAAARNLIERGEVIATPPTRERWDDLSFQTLALAAPR